MMNNFWPQMWDQSSSFGYMLPWLSPFILLDLILKGLALWKAGRSNEKYWFIALLLINSMGILPAIYLLFFQKKGK